MVKYIDAMKRPFTEIEKALIGVVLSFVPIVNLLVLGYAVTSSKKAKELPKWEKWIELFIRGLKTMFIGIFLLLPSIIVGVAGMLLLMASTAFSPIFYSLMDVIFSGLMLGDPTAQAGILEVLLGNWGMLSGTAILAVPVFLSSLLLALVGLYVTPIAVLEWYNKKNFGAAFSGNVLKKCFKGMYFINWVIVGVITMLVGIFLAFIPILGPAIMMYFSLVFSYTVFGEVYEKL